jgi:uncharacterized membrane protein YgcG
MVIYYYSFTTPTRIWTPSKLTNYSETFNDPESYLKEKINIKELIKKLMRDSGHNVKVYMISDISTDYLEVRANKLKKNYKLFLRDMSILLHEDQAERANSVIVLLSVNDQKIRIWVGDAVKHKLPDRKCVSLINSVKSLLRHKQYETLFINILSKMYVRLTSDDWANFKDDLYEIASNIMAYIMIIVLVGVLFYILVGISSNNSKPKEEAMDIDEEEYCNICMRKYENKDEKFKIMLECYHCFHYGCFAKWKACNRELCPACTDKVTMETDANSIFEGEFN